MEKLIDQLRSIVVSAQVELDEARKKNAEANQLAARTRIEKNHADSRAIDLDTREAAIEKSEGPVDAAIQARNLKSENASLSAKLNEERKEFEGKKQEFAKYVTETRQDLNTKLDEVGRQREEFKRLREELKEKEENMKDEIFKELKDKIS